MKSQLRNTIGSTRVDAAALAKLLDDLVASHELLLASIQQHREALKAADVARMSESLARQQMCLEHIVLLEQTRTTMACQFASGNSRPGPVTLSDMAESVEAVGEHSGDKLKKRAAVLRELIARVRREQAVLGQAVSQLAVHADGMMRLLVQKLSTAGVYGRSGRVDTSRAALSLDMRS